MKRRLITKLGIPRDELAVIQTLNQNQVEYLLIGGYAMRFYGDLRPAADVDLLIHNSPENAHRLFEIIRGLLNDVPYSPQFTENDLTEPCKQLNLKHCGYVLDILTSIEGLDFESALRNREIAHQRHIVIPVVAKEDLLFIKRAAMARDESRRERELRDIEFLESLGT